MDEGDTSRGPVEPRRPGSLASARRRAERRRTDASGRLRTGWTELEQRLEQLVARDHQSAAEADCADGAVANAAVAGRSAEAEELAATGTLTVGGSWSKPSSRQTVSSSGVSQLGAGDPSSAP